MLKLVLFVALLHIASVAGQCSREQTVINEGVVLCCYYDSLHIPTIGIGYNLRNGDAAATMQSYGLKLADVLHDCDLSKEQRTHCLTQPQAVDIFDKKSYPIALSCVTGWVSNHPTTVINALTDMAFMGCDKLRRFVKMKAALDQHDYKSAGQEARNSQWCVQVKRGRCEADAGCIESAGCPSKAISCTNEQGLKDPCCRSVPPAFSDSCCPSDKICVTGGCCPQEQPQLCNNQYCCKSGSACCQNGCCNPGYVCAGPNNCCPQGQPQPCSNQYCCKSGSACCPNGCCDPGYVCAGPNNCCPQSAPQLCGQYCCSQGSDCCSGLGCCNPGSQCCGNGCCPSGTYCCGAGQCCRLNSNEILEAQEFVGSSPKLNNFFVSSQNQQGLNFDYKTR